MKLRSPKTAAGPDEGMSLQAHLIELRRRIVWSLLAVLVGAIVGYIVSDHTLSLLKTPFCQLPAKVRGSDACDLAFFNVTDAFSVKLNLALAAGIVLSSPVWLYQLWAFIAPGLKKNERRWGITFTFSSILLFAMGTYVAFLVLNPALSFLLDALGPGTKSLLGIQQYLSFITTLLLVFGASFEFPLLLVLLNLAGILPFVRMRAWWRGIVFAVFAFAAIATPTGDPFSMMALAAPMCALYGVALGVAWVHDRAKARRLGENPYAGLDPDEAAPLPAARDD